MYIFICFNPKLKIVSRERKSHIFRGLWTMHAKQARGEERREREEDK